MFSKENKKYVYKNVLLNLWNGNYLTRARRGFLSEPGSRKFYNKLVEDGYILEVKKKNCKYAKFTEEGKDYLNKFVTVTGVQPLCLK